MKKLIFFLVIFLLILSEVNGQPKWFNLRHEPSTVTESDSVDIKVEWSGNEDLDTVIIYENSTSTWEEHICNLVTGICSGEILSYAIILFFGITSALISLVVIKKRKTLKLSRKFKKVFIFIPVTLVIFLIFILLFSENISSILIRLGTIPMVATKEFIHTIPETNLDAGETVFYYSFANDILGNGNSTDLINFYVETTITTTPETTTLETTTTTPETTTLETTTTTQETTTSPTTTVPTCVSTGETCQYNSDCCSGYCCDNICSDTECEEGIGFKTYYFILIIGVISAGLIGSIYFVKFKGVKLPKITIPKKRVVVPEKRVIVPEKKVVVPEKKVIILEKEAVIPIEIKQEFQNLRKVAEELKKEGYDVSEYEKELNLAEDALKRGSKDLAASHFNKSREILEKILKE